METRKRKQQDSEFEDDTDTDIDIEKRKAKIDSIKKRLRKKSRPNSGLVIEAQTTTQTVEIEPNIEANIETQTVEIEPNIEANIPKEIEIPKLDLHQQINLLHEFLIEVISYYKGGIEKHLEKMGKKNKLRSQLEELGAKINFIIKIKFDELEKQLYEWRITTTTKLTNILSTVGYHGEEPTPWSCKHSISSLENLLDEMKTSLHIKPNEIQIPNIDQIATEFKSEEELINYIGVNIKGIRDIQVIKFHEAHRLGMIFSMSKEKLKLLGKKISYEMFLKKCQTNFNTSVSWINRLIRFYRVTKVKK
jgi:hypothetical protein